MIEKANPFPTNDERMFAMLSHFSFFLGGILLPIIFWAIKKDQSQFVRFHSLQAIFFHIAYIALLIILIIILVIAVVFLGMTASFASLDNPDPGAGFSILMVIFSIVFYGGMIFIIFGAIAYGVYAGVKAYQGEMVMYPVIGKRVYAKVYGSGAVQTNPS